MFRKKIDEGNDMENNNGNGQEDCVDPTQNTNNTNGNNTNTSSTTSTTTDQNQEVLERISLLESQIKTLQNEMRRKDRRIRYSESTRKWSNDTNNKNKKLNDSSNASTSTEALSVTDSFATEDVFQMSSSNHGPRRPPSGSSSSASDSVIFDDMKMAELAAHASEGVSSMSSEAMRSRSFRYNSFITRRINADDDYKALSEDTFTMMIMSKPGSKQWWYAFTIFLVQIALLTMILHDQYSYSYKTTPFDVPYKVHPVVRAGQFLAILLSLATQTDLVIAIITFIMLWSRRRISWTSVAEVATDSHTSIWTLRIALPLSCKFIEGVLVLVTTFVIVIQSDSMIELFKDFAAMQLISELDNMMFWLALHGYAGIDLMEGARKAQKVRIKDDVQKFFCGIPLRTMVLVVVFLFMFSCWMFIVFGQMSGNFFYLKFPQCSIPKSRISSMNDGICDGGAQNTIECNFDDGDCLAFNIAYPGCRVVETQLIGDGLCDSDFNLPECGFDGGDCCPVMDDPRLGDGFCDGYVFNTEICNYDEGDCTDFNEKYPLCCGLENYTLIELMNEYNRLPHLFALGDGICDRVPMYAGPECGYDGGDCEACFEKFESHLKLEEFHIRYFDKFGDGYCDPKSPLNIEICGFDGRDCYECMVHELDDPSFNVSKLGDGTCDGGAYQAQSCYYDGGDCISFIEDYPDCEAEFPRLVGDGTCQSEYDTEECGGDGGDCEDFKEKYELQDCEVPEIDRIGNGECDGGDYLTEECAFDGGDCSNCIAGDKTMSIDFIGDGICDGDKYMTEECGWDGGDCKGCRGDDILRVGNGECDKDLDTFACGFDGGDCVADYSNSTKGFDVGNIFDTKSIKDASSSYSDELRAKLLEKALLRGLF